MSGEWIDAAQAYRMGLAWRVEPDADLHRAAATAAATIAGLNPPAVAATKRLMTVGRAEAARQAIVRELDELRNLMPPQDDPAR